MHVKILSAAALLLSTATAQSAGTGYSTNTTSPQPDENGIYWLHGTGITAGFIPYGASISHLLIKDINGVQRDIVTGFDNASYFSVDKQHGHFGGVPGRYANRIRNSTFTIDGVKYNIEPNENPTADAPKGADTLHGGPDGWDWRNFTVVSYTKESITFSIVDPDGKEGFPGEVVSFITYTLGNMTWEFKMLAVSTTKKTPIMLSSHTYWNLDGFANTDTNTALNHSFYLPYSGQRVAVDNILIPTGDILANQKYSVNDFWSAPKQIGANLTSPDLKNNCGNGCTGYDNCYTVNRESTGPYDWRKDGFVASLHSAWSGIQVDIFSDQEAFQMYSCNGQNGSMALKNTQGLTDGKFPRTIPKYGCVVMEVQDYIDGINQPAWGREKRQIYGPGDDPYVLQARYDFSVNKEHKI